MEEINGKRRKERNERKRKKIKIIRRVILALIAIVLIVALIYYGSKAYADYKEAKDYSDLSQYMTQDSDDIEEEPQKTQRMIKLEELHNEYEDIVAWLDIPGTNMSYPIVQGDDNDYYLNHTYKGESSARGSIFLDAAVDLNRPSDCFLIYGHRNLNGAMFEELINYEKESFYQDHKTFTFTTLNDDSEYEIIAAFRGRRYYTYETNVFRYYYFINAENEQEFDEYVANAKRDSMYDTGLTAEYGDQLICLSTCAYHVEHGRFAVLAKKVGKVQEETEDTVEENQEENQEQVQE